MPTLKLIRPWWLAVVAGAGLLAEVPLCHAQTTPPAPVPGLTPPPTASPAAGPALPSSSDPVVVITGVRSEVQLVERLAKSVELSERIIRVDGFDPGVIDVKAVTPTRIRIQALAQGVTNLALTAESGKVYQVEVFVKGDARHLQAIIDNRFPDSAIEAFKVQDAVALTGWVSQPEHILQIVEIAEQFYPKVLNQMQVGGVQQVKLNVKIMEVQRSKLRRMGFDFYGQGQDGFIASAPSDLLNVPSFNAVLPSFPGAASPDATAVFGLVTGSSVLQGFIEALKEEELLKVLAEPAMITTNGRPASMLSGGEFPIIVPQALGTVSIEWRQFGVRMEAVPMILGGGRVRLEVMPEFTERDFANSTTLNGTTVPALTTRRVNTQVEMRFGQTLMLAGLLSTRQTGRTAKVPFLGELPWIGAAFRRTEYDDVETELIIVITPELVAPMEKHQVPRFGPGQFTTTPTDTELFFDGYLEVPNYGDGCQFCNGGSGACDECHRGKLQQKVFTVPVEQETIPAPQFDTLPLDGRVAPPADAAPRGTEARNSLLPGSSSDQSTALRNLNRPPRGSAPASGLRQVGHSQRNPSSSAVNQAGYQTTTRPAGAAQRAAPSTTTRTTPETGSPRPGTVVRKGLPGLIEP